MITTKPLRLFYVGKQLSVSVKAVYRNVWHISVYAVYNSW